MNAMAIQIAKLPAHILRAIAFLSRIPVPSSAFSDADDRAAGAAHAYALAGVVIALPAVAVAAILSGLGAPPLLVSACAVICLVVTTGALHEDGLADTADGFFGGHDPHSCLAIMKDSRNGSYATLALVLFQIMRVAAIAALLTIGPLTAGAAMLVAAAVSRAAMVWMWAELDAARPGGVSAGAGRPGYGQATFAMASAMAAVLCTVALTPRHLVAAILAAAIAALVAYGFSHLSRSRIGGQTGDTLGAVQQLCEIAFLAVLATSL